MNTIQESLRIIFEPLIEFLRREGVWDALVDLSHKTVALGSQLIFWLDAHFDFKKVFDFVVAVAVFLFRLVVVLFGIIVDIVRWLISLVS